LNGTPTREQVSEWFRETSDDEHWVVEAIKKHLRTDEQKLAIALADFSIEDMLNGRVPGNSELVAAIFADWNAKLGCQHFRF
jgi:hypothetical protein